MCVCVWIYSCSRRGDTRSILTVWTWVSGVCWSYREAWRERVTSVKGTVHPKKKFKQNSPTHADGWSFIVHKTFMELHSETVLKWMGRCFKNVRKTTWKKKTYSSPDVYGSPEIPNWFEKTLATASWSRNLQCSCYAKSVSIHFCWSQFKHIKGMRRLFLDFIVVDD